MATGSVIDVQGGFTIESTENENTVLPAITLFVNLEIVIVLSTELA